MKYVIIGGSIAGLSAAKSIREREPHAEIRIISEEKTAPYYRPMIPFLIHKEGLDIGFSADEMKKYGLDFIYDRASRIDAVSKQVFLSSGDKTGFDRLLIATGSSPVIPDIKGLKGSGVFTLKTMDDALGIKEHSIGAQNAVILGGGFVGIKAAIALKYAGLNITIIEKTGRILPQRIDKRGSEIMAAILGRAGIGIITEDTIAEAERENGSIRSVRLSSGRTVKADVVVIAAGVKPNIEICRDSGIRVNQGIIINELLQTSVDDIYAAGDVVEYNDLSSGAPALSALWTNAEEMGRIVGKNMSGDKLKYRGFLSVMNASEIFGIPFISIGLIEPETQGFDVIVEDNTDSYRKLVFKGDMLAGAVLIGDISNAGIYTNLIKNKMPLGGLKEEVLKGSLGYIDFITSA